MPNPYASYFSAPPPATRERPGNPYQELFAPKTAGGEDEWERQGLFEVNRRTRERRLAPSFESGQPALGTVDSPPPVFAAAPGNMLPVINPEGAANLAREAIGLAGATAVNTNVNIARLPSLALQAADPVKDALLPGSKLRRDSERRNLEWQAQQGDPSARFVLEGIESQRQARAERLDPLASAAELVGGWEQGARERLAEAAQDLPAPLAVGVHQASTMAGMLADPTLVFGASRAPRALSEAGQEAAIAAGRQPGLMERAGNRMLDAFEADDLVRQRLNTSPGFREAWEAEHNALGFRRRPAAGEAVPEAGAAGDLAPRGSLARNSGEAGFVRNPWAPETGLYKRSYELRHDFVTEQNAANYLSAERSRRLEAAIPDRLTRDDMTAVFHGTENPQILGDTAEAARARLAASPHAADAEQALAAWRQRSDELWQMANDLSSERLGYFNDYLHMVYEPPVGERMVGDLGRRAPGTTSVMKERMFKNPAEAMAAGYKPRNLDFSGLMHETERAHAHTRAILGLVDDLKTASRTIAPESGGRPPILRASANPDPSRFIRVNPDKYPILQKALPGPDEWMKDLERMQDDFASGLRARNATPPPEQPALPGMEPRPRAGEGVPPPLQPPLPFELPPGGAAKPQGIYVDKDLWRNLTPILDSDSPALLDKALAVTKRINFLGSLFHGASLTEASIGSLGARGLKESAKRGFGIPGVSQVAKRLGGGQLAEDAVLEAIRAGVNVEAPRLDTMAGAFDDLLRRGEDSLLRPRDGELPGLGRRAAAGGMKAVRKTAAFYDEALWENYHMPLKVTAYHILREQQMGRKAVQQALRAGKMTETDVAREVAKEVNNHFGGQNWQLLENEIFNNPSAMKWMRRGFLSPDWNYSAIQTGLEPFSANMVRRNIGMRYWRNTAILFAAGWNSLNYALSGHPMWENEDGHHFDLDTGLREEKEDGSEGRKIFFQVGKHALELPHFALGKEKAAGRELPVGEFLLRKANPVLGGVVSAATGYSPSGIPGPLARARDEAEKEGRALTLEENAARRLQALLGGAVPFVAQKPGEIGRRLLVPFVETKGMSLHDGELALAKAIRDGDGAKAGQIRRWLSENGYTGEQINRAASRAQGKVRRAPNPYTGLLQ